MVRNLSMRRQAPVLTESKAALINSTDCVRVKVDSSMFTQIPRDAKRLNSDKVDVKTSRRDLLVRSQSSLYEKMSELSCYYWKHFSEDLGSCT